MTTNYAGLARDYEPWTVKEDALLGTDTDRVIAAKLRRSSVSIGSRRKKLGIPGYVNSRTIAKMYAVSGD
jgi:hypothetical protein